MKLYIVDAFTETMFGGNPAGVVLLDEGADFPEENKMLATAAELRYSETAFVKKLGNGLYHSRYFTPTDEVDLCGHATIATFTVLQSEGIIQGSSVLTNRTLAGDLQIYIEPKRVMMGMATPQNLGVITDQVAITELYNVMGILPETVVANKPNATKMNLLPSMISTGLPDIILPVSSDATLAGICPDYDALSALSKQYNVVGVHAFTLTDNGESEGATAPSVTNGTVTAYCRNFAPLYGIPEEAATGTSNGALTYYLYLNGLIDSGDHSLFVQGREMNRPSIIETRLEIKDAALTIQVGGTGVILAKGEIFI